MSGSSIVLIFWIGVLGCTLCRAVKGISSILKSPNVSGDRSHTRLTSTTSKKESQSVSSNKFWYKVHGKGVNGHAVTFQGGVPAETAAEALAIVQHQAKVWAYEKLYTIYIYRILEGGVIANEAEIFKNMAGQVISPPKSHDPSLAQIYERAAWTSEFVRPKSFPTVTLKE